jgi:hypothetical protein
MTSPVSIGDAIMLSQLAFTIGRAFTSGRKSAPAEFHEVQNHLFALGSALGLLANNRTEKLTTSSANAQQASEEENVNIEQDEILEQMISNCRETLSHLETLVNKYLEMDPDTPTPTQTTFKRWRQDIRKNWKKIKWTTEGGDLDKLRNNLLVHVNGLTLALSAMHRFGFSNVLVTCSSALTTRYSTQTRNVETRVSEVHNMLEDIYDWYGKNLKTSKDAPAGAVISGEVSSNIETSPQLTFEIYVELPDGREASIICPRASFHPFWLDSRDNRSISPLFQCHCTLDPMFERQSTSSRGVDHTTHLQFSCKAEPD